MSYCIWIVTPPGYTHSRCFEEVALSLAEAFAALGMRAPIVTDPAHITGRAIALGAHILPFIPHPDNLILFNLEQLDRNPAPVPPPYIELMKRHPVWDYSHANIAALAAAGIAATHCGIGYMPGLTRIPPAPVKDIDVLFIGSTNPRRQTMLQAIADAGPRTQLAFNLYGAERDALIARAKIVLNMHFYDAKVFEIVRVSYLLANRACVVSESGLDAALEAPFAGGVAFTSYDRMVQTCLDLLADDPARAAIAQKGFEQMRALSQVPMLEHALAATH